MNILPKKSWHVWNKDNLARVARDEAEAKRKEDDEQRRATNAEQEARIETLKRKRTADGAELTPTPEVVQHVNLFFKEEQESAQRSTNDEYEEEARLKKKKEEDQITVYLGQGSSELTKTEPWYHDGEQAAKADVTAKDDRTKRKHQKQLAREDPLTSLGTFMKAKQDVPYRPPPLPYKVPAVTSETDPMAKLRQERLLRESEERMRIAALKGQPPPLPAMAVPIRDGGLPTGRYFAQYNPQLARPSGGVGRPGGRPGAPPVGKYSDKYRYPATSAPPH